MFIIISNKLKNFFFKIINVNRYVFSFIIFLKVKYRILFVLDLFFLNYFYFNFMVNIIFDVGLLYGGFKSI